MATSPSMACLEKKHWWLTNRKIVDRYVKEARILISSNDEREIGSALSLAEAALALSPQLEPALELKARSLLYLRRFKEVADMLQDYIPSLKMLASDELSSASSLSSESSLSKERVTLLGSELEREGERECTAFRCFSVSDLKKKVMAGLWKSCKKEGQWRYLVLGQACCHLGMMEDAMLLLQTGKRLATAAFRRESICWSDDSFSFTADSDTNPSNLPPPRTEFELITQLLCHVKLLLRRKAAALAAFDANLHSESIRHFSKILDGRHPAPQGFLAECYMHRALAYKSSGRIAESIADCNRTLALDPSCIEALATRASLFETIRCLPDSLHDLEHLKLLYNSILRDRKLPGPPWKKHNVRYPEIPEKLSLLGLKMQELKQRVGAGETGNVDYYALIGLSRGCSKSELERAHLLLTIRHKPDKSTGFIEKCQFGDDFDLDSARDSAKMSALVLYRLIQKGYTSLMRAVVEEQAAEAQRKKVAMSLQVVVEHAQQHQQLKMNMESEKNKVKIRVNGNVNSVELAQQQQQQQKKIKMENEKNNVVNKINGNVNSVELAQRHQQREQQQNLKMENEKNKVENKVNDNVNSGSVFQGVFCRDIAVVGSLLSQVGFNRPISVKYEALSC